MLFLCPKCSAVLQALQTRAVCVNNHSYDRAKEGYYNLLLTHTALHGDNKEMVEARRAFLSEGYYKPLAERLSDIISSFENEPRLTVDFGCGEGYYTDIIDKAVHSRCAESETYGFDISKDAVRAAAKKNKRIKYAVASVYHLPLPDCAFDVEYNVFSPLAREEVYRVLKPGGRFIMAIPDAMHLFELKEKIYENPYENVVEDTALEGFELISDEALRYDMHIEGNEAITALFKMTPYAYRTRREDAAKICSLDHLKVRANFRILVYERK